MLHEMKLASNPFNSVKAGTKTIEMRLYDEKRRTVNVGDTIHFTNRDTGESVTAEVLNLHIFNSFEEMYNAFDKVSIGYKEGEIANPIDMRQFYSDEDIKKYKVVGIEIKLV